LSKRKIGALFCVVLFLSLGTIQPRRRNRRWFRRRETFSKCLSVLVPETQAEIKRHPELTQEKNRLTWHKKKAPQPFKELILSWNATRPRGNFSFYINIRHHNWSGWRKIAEWGRRNQKTFSNARKRYVHTKHVRAELQRRRVGFEYKIRVVSKYKSDLKRIKALFVNLSNERDFKIETNYRSLKSTLIDGVPKKSQWSLKHRRNKDLCSPTSLSMISRYFVKKDKFMPETYGLGEQAVRLSNRVRDQSLDIYGNWIFNVAQAYDTTQGNVLYRVQRLNNFKELYGYLVKKVPIAVSIRGRLRGSAWAYNNGHFVVVIGWDQKSQRVICIDPAFRNTNQLIRKYRIRDFARAWGRSRNLSYVSIPKTRRTQTFLVKTDRVGEEIARIA
jgi:hypothetical protein